MRAPHRKYAGAPKVPHGTSGTNSPCAMRSWKCRDHRVSRPPPVAIGRLEPRRFGSLRIDAEREASSPVLMSVFFQPSPPLPQFKEKPRLPKRTGLQVGQSEPLAISGLTRNVAFGPRGFVLPFQISRLVWPAYYIPPGKLPVCFDDL